VVPSDIGDAAQLSALPVLSKDDIREAGPALFSDGYSADNTQHTRTGGSTGVPLHVHVDRDAMNWKYAATWRHNGWAGWRPGDKVAAVWGDTDKGFHWKAWLREHFQHRTIFLDTLKFSADRLRQFHAQILRYRPSVMMGHAHSVYQFARFCQEHDLKVSGLNGIVTTAMTLLETERSVIEQAFGAKVFNRYGCEELSVIASESEAHSGLHAFSEGLILEYLPTAVDGEFELVITDLFNRAMPMIRYAIGDVAPTGAGPLPQRPGPGAPGTGLGANRRLPLPPGRNPGVRHFDPGHLRDPHPGDPAGPDRAGGAGPSHRQSRAGQELRARNRGAVAQCAGESVWRQRGS
jgi:phenylacetate-CoA ligase